MPDFPQICQSKKDKKYNVHIHINHRSLRKCLLLDIAQRIHTAFVPRTHTIFSILTAHKLNFKEICRLSRTPDTQPETGSFSAEKYHLRKHRRSRHKNEEHAGIRSPVSRRKNSNRQKARVFPRGRVCALCSSQFVGFGAMWEGPPDTKQEERSRGRKG